uniref:Saposin B-type domain-containing protein n=2 Tax=Caenorhabditis japonica TaxID=281687 RepID=A0A8R1DN74_CAEJA
MTRQMTSFVFFLSVFALVTIGDAASNNSTRDDNPSRVFCTLCEEGLALIDEQLSVLQRLSDQDLGSLVDLICAHVPRSLPIVDTLCVVLRDDLVAALTKLVQGLRSQIEPKRVCSIIPSCTY